MFNLTRLLPLSLYVHLPWCVRKCPYCDFNSYRAPEKIDEDAYVGALLRDLDQDIPRVWGRRIVSIFLGGGTPSLFSPESIEVLLSGVRGRLPLDADTEVTLEANPGTVDTARFRGFRDAGINRLSIGIQSFDTETLKLLGRIHGREEALRAVDDARAAGFTTINLDLMFGLPQQDLKEALADVKTAIDLAPDHISLYQLTIEPNTVFWAKPPTLPDDDAAWEMQQQLQTLLAQNGYRQYEVSAYARQSKRCRHNLNYWQFGDYLGIGAGAHAKISDSQGITRLTKLKQPNAYVAKAGTPGGVRGEKRLAPHDAALEFMMNALRLTEGFPTRLFQERTGLPLSVVMPALHRAVVEGWLNWNVQTIQPTELGTRLLNDLLCLFLPAEDAEFERAPATGVRTVDMQAS
jgi:putative oxygen-independent coproporphyrinogen III oxidase